MSINKVILVGRLGSDPEMRYTPSGAGVCNFSVATSENWTDKASGDKKERTEWHRIVVWGRQAEHCNKYLGKGRQVYVEGRLQTRSWEDQDGNKKYATDIVANQVQFLGGASQGAPMGATNSMNQAAPAAAEPTPYKVESNEAFAADDIPF